jgi:hypothetical protein
MYCKKVTNLEKLNPKNGFHLENVNRRRNIDRRKKILMIIVAVIAGIL